MGTTFKNPASKVTPLTINSEASIAAVIPSESNVQPSWVTPVIIDNGTIS